MQTKNIHPKTNHLIISITTIGLIFCCISIIRAYDESKIYDTLAGNRTFETGSILGQKIMARENTLQADEAIHKQEYETALQLISGNSSEDYYNRGTIQTLLAYQHALQNSVSGLQNAQIFVAQAKQSFDLAKQLTDSKTIKKAIATNETTMTSLSTIVDIKTCYSIGQTSIEYIDSIITTIQNIKETLKQADNIIIKKANILDTICYQKLHNIVDQSTQQVKLLQLQMDKNKTKYVSDFSDKIEDPMICIQTPYDNILPILTKGKQGLETYQQQHQNTIEALTSNNPQLIKELCDQSKNDAEINQQIESSVQELLQTLEDNTTQTKEQKKSSNQNSYKDFFGEDEQKVLQQIQDTNEGRIDTTLNIRGKGNYTPQRYIDDMFNQFYGNSGDFIDLHK